MTMWLEECVRGHRNSVSVRVRGDSMAPALLDGDAVLVDRDMEPRVGDVVAVKLATGGYEVGRYRWANLMKDNPGFQSVKLAPADRVLGVVVASTRMVRPEPIPERFRTEWRRAERRRR